MKIFEQRQVLEKFLEFHKIEVPVTARMSHIGRRFRAHFPGIADQIVEYPGQWRTGNVKRLAELVKTLDPSAFKPMFGDAHFARKAPAPLSKHKQFLKSPEWRRLRYKILLARGKTCECCGAVDVQIHVDHIKPASKYWHLRLDPSNLQVLCEDCNKGKGAWDETDHR